MKERVIYPDGIVSFLSKGSDFRYTRGESINYQEWVRISLLCGDKIYQVKKKNGETLTTGQNTTDGIIESFWIYEKDIVAQFTNGTGLNIEIVNPVEPLAPISPVKPKEFDYPKGIVSFKETSNDGRIYTYSEQRYLAEYQAYVRRCLSIGRIIWQVENDKKELLTVGDETSHGKIVSFWVNKYYIHATFKYHLAEIDSVHPLVQLVTEDGHIIRDGYVLFWVRLKDFNSGSQKYKKDDNEFINLLEYKYFLKFMNAVRYIRLNKPRFSEKHILDALETPAPHLNQHIIQKRILLDRLGIK